MECFWNMAAGGGAAPSPPALPLGLAQRLWPEFPSALGGRGE